MSGRMFPVLVGYGRSAHGGPASVPWAMVSPHERQAELNHYQSLEVLASRGGLSPTELVCVLRDERWMNRTFRSEQEAIDELVRLLNEWEKPPEPIPMALLCPSCGTQHIDAPAQWKLDQFAAWLEAYETKHTGMGAGIIPEMWPPLSPSQRRKFKEILG